MKQYHITLNVPDDFNPEEMGLDLQYDGDITIAAEGFQDLTEAYEKFLTDSKITIKKETVSEHDVVIFKVPKEVYEDPGAGTFLNILKQQLEATFKCPVVGYINDIDILVENADQAIDMFNSMIVKVKVRAATGVTNKIILSN